jgi:hypothetical protein
MSLNLHVRHKYGSDGLSMLIYSNIIERVRQK